MPSVEKHYLRTFNCNSCSGDDCVYIKIPRSAESEAKHPETAALVTAIDI